MPAMDRIVEVGGRTFHYLSHKLVTEEEYRAVYPLPPQGVPAMPCFKPIVSDALAVHPKQVKEAEADAARKGVPTEFLSDGRPILRTRAHRKAYLRTYGFHDRDGGYGD